MPQEQASAPQVMKAQTGIIIPVFNGKAEDYPIWSKMMLSYLRKAHPSQHAVAVGAEEAADKSSSQYKQENAYFFETLLDVLD